MSGETALARCRSGFPPGAARAPPGSAFLRKLEVRAAAPRLSLEDRQQEPEPEKKPAKEPAKEAAKEPEPAKEHAKEPSNAAMDIMARIAKARGLNKTTGKPCRLGASQNTTFSLTRICLEGFLLNVLVVSGCTTPRPVPPGPGTGFPKPQANKAK